MTTPKRVQRTRIKGGGMPKGAVYVGRPGIFGNPFDVVNGAYNVATVLFRNWLNGTNSKTIFRFERRQILKELPKLKGKDLACWCPLPEPGQPDHCHAAVLLELANPELKDEKDA